MLIILAESRCAETHCVTETSELAYPLDTYPRRRGSSGVGHPQFGLGKLKLQTNALQRLPRCRSGIRSEAGIDDNKNIVQVSVRPRL